ncbi:hypothetical protein HK102_005547 [Quaeritorhiza haematococci]|nr:hypothetical protein HK102_005547 [Quaeritorhiza haematococci]
MASTQIIDPPFESSSWSVLNWVPTSLRKAHAAQGRLLARFHTSFQPVELSQSANEDDKPSSELKARVGWVDLGSGRSINTLVIDKDDDKLNSTSPSNILMSQVKHEQQEATEALPTNATKSEKRTLVMTHGYQAGLGFFYKNFSPLSQLPGWRIYALDWLGMGQSSRPRFPRFDTKRSDDENVTEIENFFVDSLEEWRDKNGIDKMTLMGGYLSACYALKYPERVERLVLVSPAGIPKRPDDLEDGQWFRGGRKVPSWVNNLWNWNITPGTVVRFAGPFGPQLVHKYTSRRFAYLPHDESKDFHDYVYHISALPGSGEYALSGLLLPGAWARKPLLDRLANLKMPTSFFYGVGDWMDYKAALEASGNMKVPHKICRVGNAGHHLYLDNPDAFNAALIAELDGNTVQHAEVEYVRH